LNDYQGWYIDDVRVQNEYGIFLPVILKN
jgi:hypothetical protein